MTRCLRARLMFLLASTAIAVSATSYAQEPRFEGAVPLNLPRTFATSELPPEPSATEHPRLHAVWEKIPSMKRIVPHLERHEGVFHGPAASVTEGSAGTAESINWSGSVVSAAVNQYGTSTTVMSVVVPSHEQAFGNCSHDGTTYTSTWIGTDGWGTGTVEQAGLSVGVTNCSQPFLFAFIETYPAYPEIGVNNLPIAFGNIITVFGTTNQAARTECAIWVNESQNVATGNTCLISPNAFDARTIEWVVERPISGNQYVNLANYVAFPIYNGWAWSSNDSHTLAAAAESPCYISGAPALSSTTSI